MKLAVLPFVSLLAVAALAAPQVPAPVAQAPRTVAPDVVPIHDEGHDPELGPLGTWAAGRDYKCGFGDGAFVLVPYLGAEAPQALPWRWQTVAVTLGGDDLLGRGEPRERHTATRFERERGLVTERWDVHTHGVEQSFVVAKPVAVPPGELRLVGAITTPLRAASRDAACGPLEFSAAEAGYRFVYGTSTAIDADGRRCAVPASFDGERIVLHVPASFVAAASWPLLVDPLLQPLVMASGSQLGFGEIDLDAIDGDGPTQELVMVWSRAASAADHDLYVFRSAGDFTASVLLGSELSATANSHQGSATGSWIDRTLAVAWTRAGSVSSSVVVKTMAANASGTNLAGAVVLPRPANATEHQPRIAAAKVFDDAPPQALVVRVRETGAGSELWATIVATGTNQAYGTFAIAQPTLTANSFGEPSLTKGIRGDYEGWLCAYQYWSVVSQRWQVAVRRVSYIGQLDSAFVVLDGNGPSRHLMRPRIDGAFERYLVVCASAEAASYPGQLTSFAGTAIEAQRLDWDALAAPVLPWPRQIVATSPGRVLHADSVAVSTGNLSHWLTPVRGGGTARAVLLGYRGAVARDEALPGPGTAGTHVAQDAVGAYAPQHDRFVVACSHTTNHQGSLTWTCQGLVREYEALPAPTEYGNPCGLPLLRQFGDARVGNEFFTVGASGLAPGAWVVGGVSLASAATPLANFGVGGGCWLRIDLAPQNLLGTVFVTANSAGFAGFRLPIPETLPPFDLYLQFVAAGADAASLTASRGRHVPVR